MKHHHRLATTCATLLLVVFSFIGQAPAAPCVTETTFGLRCPNWVAPPRDPHPQQPARAYAIAADPSGTAVYVVGEGPYLEFREPGSSIEPRPIAHVDYSATAYGAGTGVPGWTGTYTGPNTINYATHAAISPDGRRLVVSGESHGPLFGSGEPMTGPDFATVAFDPATGEKVWAQRYSYQGNNIDRPTAMVMSPDGTRVFVTGDSRASDGPGQPARPDYATVSYDVKTGSHQWAARYDPGGNSFAISRAMAINPSGTRLFVVGDGPTIAYDALTGTQIWQAPFPGQPNAAAVTPDGAVLAVTGIGAFHNIFPDMLTVAYDAVTGEELWRQIYNGPSNQSDHSMAVVSDDSSIYITGSSVAPSIQGPVTVVDGDLTTIAYDDETGEQQWISRHHSQTEHYTIGLTIALSPDGTRLFISGQSFFQYAMDIIALSLDSSNGIEKWAGLHDGDVADVPTGAALSPDGSRLYVTGYHSVPGMTPYDWTTVAFDTTDVGDVAEEQRFNPEAHTKT